LSFAPSDLQPVQLMLAGDISAPYCFDHCSAVLARMASSLRAVAI
jgi:hypothetical protein